MLRKLTVLALFTSLLAAGVPVASASSGRAGSYIVVLKGSVDDPRAVAREHSRSHNARLGYVYEHALKGYSATMSDVAAARIARDRRVDYVEADGVVHKVTTQSNPPSWGLDRIDDRSGLDKSYEYSATGSGVRAYVIASGITSHSDFASRLVSGYDVIDGGVADDCDGHGTHVAGTIGGTAHGVAKGVTLVPVRVLNCSGSGTWSGVIAGVNWVAGDAAGRPAVANMSLGGGYSSAVNAAVNNSSDAGITYAVAAGNGNQGGKAQDACNYSPASAENALTVGATSSTDTKASWSNYGTCLDLFAPGVSIRSTTITGGTASWSGTSMASPHVAGVAALYLQGRSGAEAEAEAVSAAVTGSATTGAVLSEGSGSPNLLLYSLLTPPTPPSPPEPAAPVAVDDSATAVTGEPVTIDVLTNDSDANGDDLTVTNLSTPTDGSAAYSDANTTVTYTAPATEGTYTFTYTARDSGGLESNTARVSVSVSEPPPPPAGVSAATIGYSTSGGRLNDKHLAVRAVLTDDGDNPVANTSIEVWIYRNGSHSWTGTGTTLGDGSVTWEIKNAPSGTYTTTVKNVAGASWTGPTQDGTTNTGFTK